MTIENKVWLAVLEVLFNDPQGLSQISFEELRSVSPDTKEFREFRGSREGIFFNERIQDY